MWTLFEAILIDTMLILVVICLSRVFREKISPKILILLWILVGFRFLSPIFPASDFSIESFNLDKIDYIFKTEDMMKLKNIDDTDEIKHSYYEGSNIARNINNRMDKGHLLVSIKNIISRILLIYYLLVYIFSKRSLDKLENIADMKVLALFNNCKTSLNIRRNVDLRFDRSPYTFGIFKQSVVIPRDIEEDELEFVIYHELIHCKYYDCLWNIIGMIIIALNWFNPFVWYGFNCFKKDLEELCDFRVLEIKNDRYLYSTTLFRLMLTNNSMKIGGVFMNESDIKQRIEIISKNRSFKKIWAFVGILIIGFTSLVFATEAKGQNNIILPVEKTFYDLGYKTSWNKENNTIVVKNEKKSFLLKEGKILDKKLDDNIYSMKMINNEPYMYSFILEDLGYKINYKTLTLRDRGKYIKLRSEIKGLDKGLSTQNVSNPSKKYSSKLSSKDLKDYTIREKNDAGLYGEDLSKFIRVNYNQSIEEYQENLVAVEKLYPKALSISYIAVEDDKFLVHVILDNDEFIASGVEVRNKTLYIER